MPAISSTEAIPQAMQRLVGFAAPPRREPSDRSKESFGAELEHVASDSYSARPVSRPRKDR
jgi:hypothetical protein